MGSEKSAMTEREAKVFLSQYGIYFNPETYVDRQSDVTAAARKMGFPVVVKGMGRNLLHKSDRGLVHLNLSDAGAVERAVSEITAAAAQDLEGYSIQPHIKGRRELVAACFGIVSSGRWSCSAPVVSSRKHLRMSVFVWRP